MTTARHQRWTPARRPARLRRQHALSAASVWARLAGKPPPPQPAFLLSVHGPGRRRHFRYAGINESYRAHLAHNGVTEPVIGRDPAEVLPPEFSGEALGRYDDVAERCEPLRYEVGFEFSDRSLEYEVTLEPILDGAGQCTHVLGVARDLSELAAEASVRESERRFGALVEHSSDMVTVVDATGRILYGSPSVTTVLGWPSGSFTEGDPSMPVVSAFDLIHPDDRAEIVGIFQGRVDETKPENRREFRMRRADGSWCWVEAIATNRIHDPAVKGIVVNARDISERRAAHDALQASQERFRSLVQHASEFVVVYDATGDITYLSPAAARFAGVPADDLVGTDQSDLVHPDDRDQFVEGLAGLLGSQGKTTRFTARLLRFDDEYRWLEVIATNLLDDPNVGGIVVNARDITDRFEAERALRESEERFRSAFEHAPIGMALADAQGRVLRSNRAFARMLGRQPADLANLQIRDITHPDDWGDNADHIQRLFAGEFNEYTLEKRYLHADGHVVWVSLSVSAVRDTDGTPLYMIGQIEDITERKAIGERLAHQAVHDPLTGLPNRTFFIDRLRKTMGRVYRRRNRVAVLFLDVDHFKVINDSLGHEAGDQLLITLGHRLRRMLRPSDTVARFGGDEFTILCPDVDDPSAVRVLAERVLDEVARPVVLADNEVFVTASIGIACSGRNAETPETLVRDADTAMYRAKDQGRHRAEFFDERSRARTLEHLHTGNALHRALERGEFELHYQPILELETGRVVGFEALIRWRHPERGLVAPIEFIGLAEETGLIVPIGAWVLETACVQAARWQAARPDQRPVTISANVSPRQLTEPSFPDQIARVLDHSGIRPGTLWLEITETTLMHDTESASSALRALRAQGIHLAVDDFGTGYSSLSHLKRFPIEALKIDQSFVRGLADNTEDAAIVTAVISLAHALGLSSTAEGVETPEQLAALRTLGCELAQGHLFAEPQPASLAGELRSWALH
ncbi:MAG TPA: EAL domain-containing protein [Acidimicrobiia bacterium]|nr:EAL domain-containing protein [Acidimicrobiia bacterium]